MEEGRGACPGAGTHACALWGSETVLRAPLRTRTTPPPRPSHAVI